MLFAPRRTKTGKSKKQKGGSMNSEYMDLYYYYWERKIYNAIVKMILRGLLTYLNLYKICANELYKGDHKLRKISLFQIQARYNSPNINFQPERAEIRKIINKLSSNLLETAKKFPRWMDKFCKPPDQKK